MEYEKKGIFNIKDYLSQHDIVYEKAASEWENHIPMANGCIGGALWGDNPMKITLDRYDIWELRSSCTVDKGRYNYKTLRDLVAQKNKEEIHRSFEPLSVIAFEKNGIYPTRLPIGRAEIEFESKIKSYNARLNLNDGIVTGILGLDKGCVEWKAYVHATRNAIIFDMKLKDNASLKAFNAKPVQDLKTNEILRSWGYKDCITGIKGSFEYLNQQLPAGGEYAVMWSVKNIGHSKELNEEHILLSLTISSSNETDNPITCAYNTLLAVNEINIEELEAEHNEWWNRYWERSLITIHDSRLESLFYIEMYKLGCSTRPEGFPISIQGLWTQDNTLPPWSGDYHFDMNVQECYWPIYTSNRLELGNSLYSFVLNNISKMEKFCEEFYGWKGAMLQCAVAYENYPIWSSINWDFWPGSGPWIAHFFWLNYLYTKDIRFLRDKAYPVMKKFMAFYAGLLEMDENGVYHLPFTTSPEWKEDSLEAWGRDSAADIGLIRFLCEALIESSVILDMDNEDRDIWVKILNNLAPYPTSVCWGKKRLDIMDGVPLSASHRHHSHLMPIYPLGLLNIEKGEEDRSLIDTSILTLWHKGTGEWTGWSFPWASLIYSRCRLGNAAGYSLKQYMDGFIMKNTQHINGDPGKHGLTAHLYRPMTIEAGFAAAAAIMEMLLQSWGGIIRVFPSVPDTWLEAAFEDLRAEGAFIVSSRLEDGKVVFIKITSKCDGICKVRNTFENGLCIFIDVDSGIEKEVSDQEISFHTLKGKTYYLLSKKKTGIDVISCRFMPLKRDKEDCNVFGIKTKPKW